jgi:hypothetical protein
MPQAPDNRKMWKQRLGPGAQKIFPCQGLPNKAELVQVEANKAELMQVEDALQRPCAPVHRINMSLALWRILRSSARIRWNHLR